MNGGVGGVASSERQANHFGWAEYSQRQKGIAHSSGCVYAGLADGAKAGCKLSANSAVSDYGAASGQADLAAMGVAGEDQVDTSGGQGFGQLGIVAYADGEQLWVSLQERLADVGGGSSIATDATEVEGVSAGQLDALCLVGQNGNTKRSDAIHEDSRVVIALDGVDGWSVIGPAEEVLEDGSGGVDVGRGVLSEPVIPAAIAGARYQIGALLNQFGDDSFF